jgi:hypothetical protein
VDEMLAAYVDWRETAANSRVALPALVTAP